MCRFCGRKNCGFAGIDFILPTDEDEWLCVAGTGHVEGSPGTHHTYAHAPDLGQVGGGAGEAAGFVQSE